MNVACKTFYDSLVENRKNLNIPEIIRNMCYRCQTGFFILYCFKGCYNVFKINHIMLNSVSFLGCVKKWMCPPLEKLCNVKLKMDSVIIGDICVPFLIKCSGYLPNLQSNFAKTSAIVSPSKLLYSLYEIQRILRATDSHLEFFINIILIH